MSRNKIDQKQTVYFRKGRIYIHLRWINKYEKMDLLNWQYGSFRWSGVSELAVKLKSIFTFWKGKDWLVSPRTKLPIHLKGFVDEKVIELIVKILNSDSFVIWKGYFRYIAACIDCNIPGEVLCMKYKTNKSNFLFFLFLS